jgi:hypothetical protein
VRITDERYNQHRRSLDLAWRMISYEARTSTIARWTQLSGHRVRALYRSYAPTRGGDVIRHRGMSPYRLDAILSSPRLRREAATFCAFCKILGVLPSGKVKDVERTLPSLERGELLCDAFEWFRRGISAPGLTFEHAVLVLNELVLDEQIELTTCRTCKAVILVDRLSTAGPNCTSCALRAQRPVDLCKHFGA